jgi:hypothetical protein
MITFKELKYFWQEMEMKFSVPQDVYQTSGGYLPAYSK